MIFTLEQARVCLEQVRGLTESAVTQVAGLTQAAESLPPGGEEQRELATKAQGIINDWAQAVVDLGAEAKGLWLVDFDSGDGYWCWKYPEDSLDYFHGYEDGFTGRRFNLSRGLALRLRRRGSAVWLGAPLLLAGACHACEADAPRRVVDFHTHIALGSEAEADAVFARAGVEVAVRLSGVPFGPRLEAILRQSAAMHTKVVVFAGVPWNLVDAPDFGDLAADDLRRSVALGARGLKVSKVLGLGVRTADGALLPVDSERLDPLWRAAGELRVPVAIHTGDPLAFFTPPDAHNERLAELRSHPDWSFYGGDYPSLEELMRARDRLVARHPQTTFVAVHVGGFPERLDSVAASMRAHPNLWIDLAARIPEIGRQDPGRVRAFFEEFGDRIVFGTDLQVSDERIILGSAGDDERAGPSEAQGYYEVHWRYLETDDRDFAHATPIQGAWPISGIDLAPRLLRAVYRDNARRLLGLPE